MFPRFTNRQTITSLPNIVTSCLDSGYVSSNLYFLFCLISVFLSYTLVIQKSDADRVAEGEINRVAESVRETERNGKWQIVKWKKQ